MGKGAMIAEFFAKCLNLLGKWEKVVAVGIHRIYLCKRVATTFPFGRLWAIERQLSRYRAIGFAHYGLSGLSGLSVVLGNYLLSHLL